MTLVTILKIESMETKSRKNTDLPLREQIIRNINKLTTSITYIVLVSFVVILSLILIKAWIEFTVDEGNIKTGEVWLDIFKDGFIILSGILTTLIGYYFGSKGNDISLEKYEQVSSKAEEFERELERLSPTNEDITEGIEPINPIP